MHIVFRFLVVDVYPITQIPLYWYFIVFHHSLIGSAAHGHRCRRLPPIIGLLNYASRPVSSSLHARSIHSIDHSLLQMVDFREQLSLLGPYFIQFLPEVVELFFKVFDLLIFLLTKLLLLGQLLLNLMR